MLASPELVWLLAATAKGDADAFERLFLATRSKLYGVALRILRRPELADEVMQETYERIWRQAGEFNPRLATPTTWMVGIARNGALDLLRKRPGAVGEDEPETAGVSVEAVDPARREMTDMLRFLLACMGRLDERQRYMLLLAYYNGWSREQLARKLDVDVATIKSWLGQSLTQIRECLGR